MRKLGLFVIPLMAISLLASCGNSPQPPQSFKIAYENLQGSTTDNPTSYTVNDSFKLKNPTGCTFSFNGWLLGGKSGELITEIKKGTKGDLTLWATWDETLLMIDESYIIVADKTTPQQSAYQINDALSYYKNYVLTINDVKEATNEKEIIIDRGRQESEDLSKTLNDNQYAIKVVNNKLIIGYTSELSRNCAIDHLLTDYCNEDGLKVPTNLSIVGECRPDKIIEIDLPKDKATPDKYRNIRDPFVLKDGNKYYMYGTTEWDGVEWRVYGAPSLKGEWNYIKNIVDVEPDDVKYQRWAPEVHKYKDNYYMFTTYNRTPKEHDPSVPDNRGVTIFKSNGPTGPFTVWSENIKNNTRAGHITEDNLGCTIDGTLYVDINKQPWLIYVKEWVDCPDKIGLMNIVKLSDDLKTIGDPITLFSAHDGPWCRSSGITDGCFVHRMKDGSLVMLWSNTSDVTKGYSTGMLINREGDAKINDPNAWVHQDRMLYTTNMYNDKDGGHSMIFEDNGQLYMCQHGPNGSDQEHPIIVPIKEAYGTLVWDLYQ